MRYPQPDLSDFEMLFGPADEESPQCSSLGLSVEDILMPELVHHGEEGYISLPPSPSVISFPAASGWSYAATKLGCDNVLTEGCEAYFAAASGMSTDPFFDSEAISDIVSFSYST